MAETYDLILRGGTVVGIGGIGPADIAVRGGRVARIGDLPAGVAGEEIDCRGLTVLPVRYLPLCLCIWFPGCLTGCH